MSDASERKLQEERSETPEAPADSAGGAPGEEPASAEKASGSETVDAGAPPGLRAVVGLGASAGGLGALQELFEQLPAASRTAFVVILHLSPEHESRIAELLQRYTEMPVQQVTEPTDVEGGRVYVIPPRKDLSMLDGQIRLSERDPSRRHRAPIDLFFRTLAEAYGRDAAAVVLSGTGSDGSVGLKRVKERGGLTFAQQPEEAEYDGMPRSAIATGAVDLVLPLDELARKLSAFDAREVRSSLPDPQEELSGEDGDAFPQILAHLRTRTGHDFTNYKRPTLMRRLARRMQLRGIADLPAYLEALRERPEEAEALVKDVLITVTNFFRDEETFEALEEQVIPQLFEEKAPGDDVRVWCAGCATGEEAYSLAMLLTEAAGRLTHPPGLQVFASDLSGEAIEEARQGLYPESIAADVSEARLKRFFTREPGGYQVKKGLREKVLFTEHNLLRDPPFSKLDLVVCRNLLIYLQRSVHGRVLELFHYALLPGGYLFLGASETADAAELFRPVDKKHRLFQRRAARERTPSLPSVPIARTEQGPAAEAPRDPREEQPGIEALHRELRVRHAPASLIVDRSHAVVHLSHGAGRFLTVAPGRPTKNLLKMAREGLRVELRTALHRAFRKQAATQSRPIPVQTDEGQVQVELLVEPVEQEDREGEYAHVLFREVAAPAEQPVAAEEGAPAQEDVVLQERRAQQIIGQLEGELEQVRAQLSAALEEREATVEELKASNEELQSMNEELKSTAEELETSKEELQSMNEELATLNQEHKSKIEELARVNSDLRNLMASTEIGTIFLDRELRVKRYTPRVEDLFNIIESDLDRPLAHVTNKLGYDQLPQNAEEVLRDLTVVEREVHSEADRWFQVRLRPYRTVEDKIDGVAITFVDITARRKAEMALREFNEKLEARVAMRTGQVRRLASDLVLAEQKERHRIAQLLHDNLQQQLYGIQLKTSFLQRHLSADGEEGQTGTQQQTSEMYELLDEAIETTRALTVDLSPPVLEGEGLAEALRWLAEQMETMHGLQVEIDAGDECRSLGEDQRVLLYQMVRELLFNVVKHAQVGRARVTLGETGGECSVEVVDEGVGFDGEAAPAAPARNGGFGLSSVRDRVNFFGGRLEIDSAPGEGTRITLALPFDVAERDASAREALPQEALAHEALTQEAPAEQETPAEEDAAQQAAPRDPPHKPDEAS